MKYKEKLESDVRKISKIAKVKYILCPWIHPFIYIFSLSHTHARQGSAELRKIYMGYLVGDSMSKEYW